MVTHFFLSCSSGCSTGRLQHPRPERGMNTRSQHPANLSCGHHCSDRGACRSKVLRDMLLRNGRVQPSPGLLFPDTNVCGESFYVP